MAKTYSEWFDERRAGKWNPPYDKFDTYAVMFPSAESLRDATAEDIRDNAHRFYDAYPVDSEDRESAFEFASSVLGIDYDIFFDAWLFNKPYIRRPGMD